MSINLGFFIGQWHGSIPLSLITICDAKKTTTRMLKGTKNNDIGVDIPGKIEFDIIFLMYH